MDPARAVLLVLASTYPRWEGDPEPGFVHELCKRLVDRFRVIIVGPHAAGAKTREIMEGVEVRRYRYAPVALETLVNDGGIVANLRRQPWKWLLLPGFVFGMLWAAWRAISNERPDVAHAHWLIPQGLALALLGLFDRRVPPFLVTSHGADLFALRARPLQALKRFVTRRAAAVTVVSESMREELQRIGAATGRVSVQPMGVDLASRFTPGAGVARSNDEILFVGRLVEKKGLRYLIDAMPTVIATRPSAFLSVAGFGPEEPERREQARRLGLQDRVNFIGAVPQSALPAMYRRAAVFAAPFVQTATGDQEGLGLVVVEAAGCGCPVVVSDLPAVRQIFADDREAWRVPPGDPRGLAAALVAVLSSPAHARARAEHARNSLVERFDWEGRARRYEAELQDIMR